VADAKLFGLEMRTLASWDTIWRRALDARSRMMLVSLILKKNMGPDVAHSLRKCTK
jgi:hypothetical protein